MPGTAGKLKPHGEGEKPKMMKTRRIRARNKDKVRFHLPPIEAYEKELEFAAEGPGRVIVRLERLMGSDKIRITDTKYMTTLLERLEEEERVAWDKKRFTRILAERNRFRKLAIDGLMEPGPDMQDLYHHPVFRVNRVLKRLESMDHHMTTAVKLPPIVPVDPFAYDENGRAFIAYPGHALISTAELSELNSLADLYDELDGRIPKTPPEEEESEETPPEKVPSQISQISQVSQASRASIAKSSVSSKVDRMSTLPSRQTILESVATAHRIKTVTEKDVETGSLPEMQKSYGIDDSQDLEKEWAPFRSQLVGLVYEPDELKIQELYQVAEDVLGSYERENLVADDFVLKLNKMMQK